MMNAVSLFIVFVSTKVCFAAFDPTEHPNWALLDNDRCGNSAADRIIGGVNASLGQYPWLVRIGYSDSSKKDINYGCGGAILNQNTILTAAHCVFNLDDGLKLASVVVGELDAETNPDCDKKGHCADPIQELGVDQVISHSRFTFKHFQNDIAIVRLNQTIKIGTYARPICLLHGDLVDKDWLNNEAEVAGWGVYDIDLYAAGQGLSTMLQTVSLPVIEPEICKEMVKDTYPFDGKTQMCVGGKVGLDSCKGDSGGPLMMVDAVDTPRTFLIGLVSYGSTRCGETDSPGVYTRVSAFLEWILSNLKENTSDFTKTQ